MELQISASEIKDIRTAPNSDIVFSKKEDFGERREPYVMITNQKQQNMKANNPLFFKIWCCHISIFYPICVLIQDNIDAYALTFKHSNFHFPFETILWSPLYGILGFWDNSPLFIIAPILIMKFFILRIKSHNYLILYILLMIISYLSLYVLLLEKTNRFFFMENTFYYIIPSLAITFLINWLIFKKDLSMRIH